MRFIDGRSHANEIYKSIKSFVSNTISPYGEASRITLFKKNMKVLDGGTIYISEKSIQDVNQDRFQQVSSLVSSLVSIALLATTVSR